MASGSRTLRQRWSDAFKKRIVAEARMASGCSLSSLEKSKAQFYEGKTTQLPLITIFEGANTCSVCALRMASMDSKRISINRAIDP
jgi:hypothetical protein